MRHEVGYEGPSSVVGMNRYYSDRKQREQTSTVREQEWYIARVILPDSENINQFARDFLIRVIKIEKLKGGGIVIYATAAKNDGSNEWTENEMSENDKIPMNADGCMIDEGSEQGYLLSVFKRKPDGGLGTIATEAEIEIQF